jgi:hypothetical protein
MACKGAGRSALTTPHKLQGRGSVGNPSLAPSGCLWAVAKRRPRPGSFMRWLGCVKVA